MFQNLQKSEGKLADLISQNQKLASENIINSARYKEADKRLALFNKPGNKTIKLSGLPIAPHASVLVQWNSVSGDLFISGNNLPALPSGKQYQLWAIIDGKPVDAGIVSLDAEINGIYEMNKISKAQAFAVSLEKEGGSLVPTMEAIYVMGSI